VSAHLDHGKDLPRTAAESRWQYHHGEKGRVGILGILRRVLWSWWLWLLLGATAISVDRWNSAIALLAWAAFSYLITPQEESPKYGLDSKFFISSEKFLSSIAGTTGVPFLKGNSITILNNGDEFYPVMLDAIAQAKQSITIEAYIYWAGGIGWRFAQALADKARSGVTVKILLDAVGSSTIGKEILETLESSGCQVAWFNPVRWRTIGRYNNRTHRKSLIIDGRVAFTGGAGIADHWLGHAEDPKHWRDLHVRIEGPATVALQTGFAQNWLKTTCELISGDEYFPTLSASGGVAVQTILSSPEVGASALRIMYYLSIVCARRTLYIANPYFIPDSAAIDILIEAKKRGVDVKIMVSGVHNDMKLARYSSVHLYGKLLECGVEIYEYNKTMLHQKTMVADSAWITVGTTNFDNRSFALNEESNICAYDAQLAAKLDETFGDDIKGCTPVDYESWKRRGLAMKIKGAASCFLRDQI
jgi:cardiolipin synthase A/B